MSDVKDVEQAPPAGSAALKAMMLRGYVEPVRARTDKGEFAADNPATPDVNEAWVGGKKATKKTKAKE
jgi:hypothetical protein